MFHALGWVTVLVLVAFWSLLAWAFHGVATWTIDQSGVLAGGTAAIDTVRVPDWLASWLPPQAVAALTSAAASFAPAIDALIAWLPALAGGLSVAVWVVWALGSGLLVVLGLVLSAAIAVFRRRADTRGRPMTAARASG